MNEIVIEVVNIPKFIDEFVSYARKLGYSDEDIANFTNMLIAVNDTLVINYNKTIPALFNHTKYFVDQSEKTLCEEASEFITVNASVDIDPDTINLKSKGKWITAWIEIPSYDVSKINISSVYLNGIVQAENNPKYGFVRNPEIKDRDGDGYPELVVKFDRQEVKKVFSEPRDQNRVVIEIGLIAFNCCLSKSVLISESS